jgi:hypothetical protein
LKKRCKLYTAVGLVDVNLMDTPIKLAQPPILVEPL